jgi:hypothetical protein
MKIAASCQGRFAWEVSGLGRGNAPWAMGFPLRISLSRNPGGRLILYVNFLTSIIWSN